MSDVKGKDTLMKLLLSSSTLSTLSPPSPAHNNIITTNVASPISDGEDDSSKMSLYLNQISSGGVKAVKTPWDKVYVDHNYSKTGDTKVDQWKLRPTRTLFMTKVDNTGDENESLDITTEQENTLPPYDLTRAQQLMNECERCVSFARMEQGSDDWEDTITRIGWTAPQNLLFNKIVKILHSDRLSRLANIGNKNEPVHRRLAVDKSALRFRTVMVGVAWDTRLSQWLHVVLVENLSTPYLAAYLDILQTLKSKIPTMIEKMMSGSNQFNKLTPVITEGLNLLLKRPWDPTSSCVNHHKLRKLPGNPVIIVVPSGPKKNQNVTNRALLWNTQLSQLGTVVVVPFPVVTQLNKSSMANCLEQIVTATKSKLAEVRLDCPGRPVILLGWRSGAALACQIAVVESVSCVVSLGMASRTVEGKKGEVEDTLLDMISPVLFVMGENAASSRRDDFEAMREKMQIQSGLLVVGGSDDYLRMNTHTKSREGVTQNIVDTCVIEEIGDFLTGVLSIPPPAAASRMHAVYSNISAILSTMSDNRKSIYQNQERKRNNSNTSSLDSEPSAAKRSRPGSPQSVTKQRGSPAPRGRRPGSGKKNLAPPVAQVNSTTPAQPGGITMNIGAFASLGQIGPLRLNPVTSTQQQTTQQSTYKIQSPRPYTKHVIEGAQTFVIQAGNKLVPTTVNDREQSTHTDSHSIFTNTTATAGGTVTIQTKSSTQRAPAVLRAPQSVTPSTVSQTLVVSPSPVQGGIKSVKAIKKSPVTSVVSTLPRSVVVSRTKPTIMLQRSSKPVGRPRSTVTPPQRTLIKSVSPVTNKIRAFSAGQQMSFTGKMLPGGAGGNVIVVSDSGGCGVASVVKSSTSTAPLVKMSVSTKQAPLTQSRIIKHQTNFKTNPLISKAITAKLAAAQSKTTPIIVQRSNILRNRHQIITKPKQEATADIPVVIPIINAKRASNQAKVYDVSYGDDGDTLSFPLDCDIEQADDTTQPVQVVIEGRTPTTGTTGTTVPAGNKYTQLILAKQDVKKTTTQMVLESASGEQYLIEEDDDDDDDESQETQVLLTDDDQSEYILDCSSVEEQEGEVVFEIVDSEAK